MLGCIVSGRLVSEYCDCEAMADVQFGAIVNG